MNNKIKDFMTVFLIQLVIAFPFYTVNAYALTISNVQVTKVTATSATIEWDTDDIANGAVKYGKTTALGFTQRHDNFIQNHTVSVFNGIESDTNYFFSVESTDLNGATATDDNSNNFYTFKTTDITPPPEVTGLMVASRTSSSIFLSWNALSISDFNHFIVERNGIPVTNVTSNSFNDTNLSSGTSFNYKVSAVDNSGNIGSKSNIVITSTFGIDLTNPVISGIDILPITDTISRISWLTDENSTSTVFYGINKTDKVKSSADFAANHTISIDGLVKGVKHSIIVQSCDGSGNCANSSVQNFTAGRDLIPPFINLTIPRFVNRRVIDIIGSTEPFTSVTLFVNDMRIPKRSLSNSEVGGTGKFVFAQIQLEQDNVIKMVFVDKSGNKNEQIFDVSVDTESPVVKLNDVPSLTSKTNVTFSGTVNEPVTIKVFVEAAGSLTAIPSKVTGLNATKVGQNFVEIHWNETQDKDFSHYVVYRQDASPIAVTKPADFNLFIDALVDSGKSYTYQVSAVNVFANEGQKSEPITVTTLKNGLILGIKPSDVDIFAEFKKPFLLINSTGSFNFGIKLDKGDGAYKVRIVLEDRAGNNVVLERSITLDTKKPQITITSPPQGAFVFENVAHEIDITGTTKPNARVHLFVDRTPFSFFNETLEISGLPNQIDSVPETQLDAKCRSKLVANSFCRTGADFSTTADAQGDFKFERVDVTTVFGGAARISEVSPSQLANIGGNLNQDARQSRTTTLVVIATDQVGLRGVATQTIRIGTCWSGNQSWDIIPLQQYQSPAFISTERLAEGTEQIYFYLNFSYIGPGTNAQIKRVSITKACSDRQLVDSRFNVSCLLMPAGNTPRLLNPPENTVSYSAMPLTRMPGMQSFLGNDWKKFFKAVNNELTFPLQIRIEYVHDKNNDGKLESEVQTTCEQVSYVLDKSIIDPRKVLPDWLLFDGVEFLQSSIKTLDSVQVQLNQLLQYVTFGCITSWGLNVVLGIYRRWMSFADEKIYLFAKSYKDLADTFSKNFVNSENSNDQNNKDYCNAIINKINEDKKGFRLKYLSDRDLKKCFPRTSGAWDAEAKAYKYFQLTCYRVFGHSSPSAWTEEKKDEDIFAKIEKPSGCKKDQGAAGQPIRAMSCTEFARQNTRWSSVGRSEGPDKKCVLVTQNNQPKVYVVEDLVQGSDNLYKLIFISQEGNRGGDYIYAVRKDKSNEVDYIVAQSKTCPELCGVTQKQGGLNQFTVVGDNTFTLSNLQAKTGTTSSTTQAQSVNTLINNERLMYKVYSQDGKIIYENNIGTKYDAKNNGDGSYTFYVDDTSYKVNKDNVFEDTSSPTSQAIKGKATGCATINNCLAFNKQTYIGKDEKGIEREFSVDYAQNAGFSKECFYDPNDPNKGPDVVSDNPDKTVVCCCVNTNKEIERRYYQPDDIVTYADAVRQQGGDKIAVQAHQRKQEGSQIPVVGGAIAQVQNTLGPLTEKDFKKIDWSYRYFKEGFITVDKNNPTIKHTQYNPNRYITGRDFPACFGQDLWFYAVAGKEQNIITINPAQEHTAAFQCAHISGIINRIQMLKNIATAMSTCLIQVRTTGKADGGTCKELFTQYLCGSFWQVVRFFIDGCTPKVGDTVRGWGDNEILQYVRGGLKGVSDSVSDLQSTMNSEFGNAKLNELFGLGEESIARKVCLAAFGYDWNLNLKNFIDAAYSTPFATLVQAVTRSREFLTVEPGNLRPKYEYRASWLINPGCDFERYNVYLSCVGQRQINKYPNDVSCSSVGAPSIFNTGAVGFNVGNTRVGGPSQAFSQCDCTNLPDERKKLVYSGRLTQNKLEDVALPAGQRVVTDDVRYDHIEFELIPDRKIPANIKPNCFPTGYDEGKFYFPLTDKTARDIFDCRVDFASGAFICGQGQAFGAKKGTANFLTLNVGNGVNSVDSSRTDIIFNAGEPLIIDATIRNIGKEKCIKAVLDGEVRADLIQEGINQYKLQFSKALSIGTAQGISVAPTGVSVEPGNSQNSQTVVINLRFYDSGTSKIDFNGQDDDTVQVDGVSEPSFKKVSEISKDLNNPTFFGTGEQRVGLIINNGALVVRRQNAEIRIGSAEIQKNANGKPSTTKLPGTTTMDVAYSYAQITVQPTTQIPSTSTQNQQKTLEIGLYNINDNVETAENNLANCNFNDLAVGSGGIKRVNFRVQQKPTLFSGAIISDPIIRNQNGPTRLFKKTDIVNIDVRVSNNNGNPTMQCTFPDRKQEYNSGLNSGIYTFVIQSSDIKYAGTYTCTIIAPSSNTDAPISPKELSFDVSCGSGNEKCNANGDCIGIPSNTNPVTPCFKPQASASSTVSGQNVNEFPTPQFDNIQPSQPFLS